MPISDLLASISGSQPKATSTPPKRKAADDLKPTAKAVRQTPPPTKPSQMSRPLDRPKSDQKPTNGQHAKPSSPGLKPANGVHRVTKPAAPARPTQAAPTNGTPVANKVAPKKGSYAEILARAKKAQEAMGQVGKIQHKKVEKKGKDLPQDSAAGKADPRVTGKKPAGSTGYQGTSKSTQRSGVNGNGSKIGGASRDGRGKPLGNPATSDRERKAAQEEHEKKIKKASLATTGYTGTARPKPGTTTKKDKAARGGALLNKAPPRPSGSRHSQYEDDYDEELDDFIEYDDDEDDQGGPRYHYDSDGSSDMEAGVDEMYGEEQLAEKIARKEDLEEQRLEERLKSEKEERKRKALEALRAKGRSR